MSEQLDASQLGELCAALGWQGGTYRQVLAEVSRLRKSAHVEQFAALRTSLRTLLDVCHAMDAEILAVRPSEEAYEAAIEQAQRALALQDPDADSEGGET